MRCPRCDQAFSPYRAGVCPDCAIELQRIYADRRRVFIAALAHLETDEFNKWLKTPNDSLGGDTPMEWIEAGFTDQVIDLVKTYRREGVVSALETVVSVEP